MIQIEEDGTVRIELPHGEAAAIVGLPPAATIEGLPPDAVVERGDKRALFLEQQEAETLGKMIDYILTQIEKGALRIRTESEEALRKIRPRLDGLFRA